MPIRKGERRKGERRSICVRNQSVFSLLPSNDMFFRVPLKPDEEIKQAEILLFYNVQLMVSVSIFILQCLFYPLTGKFGPEIGRPCSCHGLGLL
jgi:hypothetical protein